jgi:uncharacterized MAPEG superfamily protein
MTSELTALTFSAVLCALLAVPYGFPQTSVWGLRVAMGNRENPPPLPEWANRAIRAHRNMLENLPHFSVLVIVAVLADSTNQLTAWGAWGFFAARLVHAVVYIAGIPYVRTAAFFAGILAELAILSQLWPSAA